MPPPAETNYLHLQASSIGGSTAKYVVGISHVVVFHLTNMVRFYNSKGKLKYIHVHVSKPQPRLGGHTYGISSINSIALCESDDNRL